MRENRARLYASLTIAGHREGVHSLVFSALDPVCHTSTRQLIQNQSMSVSSCTGIRCVMSSSLSRLVAPLAAVYVAFGVFFSVYTSPAYAEPASSTVAVPHSAWETTMTETTLAGPSQPGETADPADASTLATQPVTGAPLLSSRTIAQLKAELDQTDRLAVLEAIHVGLSDAPDGATYMWRRHNGKIAGSVHPTTSFRDTEGRVCRFLVFQLMLGAHLSRVEGIACRQDDRSWLLEG